MSINRKIKTAVKSAVAEIGFILEKKTALNSEELLLEQLLRQHGIDCVLDIGANTGQFAMDLLKTKFTGKLISFEPLPDVYARLASNSKGIGNWQTENTAVGNESGYININVSANKESSSILPMLQSHADLAPESKYVASISVPIVTLDNYLKDQQVLKKIFLKIDVQGYEMSVLEGALETLARVEVIQLEMSFVPLYDHSLPYYTLMQRLEDWGFSLYSLLPAFTDYKTGQVFQVDAVYVKRPKES